MIEISSEICFVLNFFFSKINEFYGYERMLKSKINNFMFI